jgi:hypothetical protein
MGPRRKANLPLRKPKAAKYRHELLYDDVSSSRARSSSEELDDEEVQEDIRFGLGEGNKSPDGDNEAEVGS